MTGSSPATSVPADRVAAISEGFLANAGGVYDADSRRAEWAAKIVEDGRRCQIFGSYRELLDRTDIDAVVISISASWHALITIHTCQAGKDVYIERPLSLTIGEGRHVVEAARANNRGVQTGSQNRSPKEFRTTCELALDRRAGKLQTVLVGMSGPNHPASQPRTPNRLRN